MPRASAPRGRPASPRTCTPTATSPTPARTTPSTRARSTSARCSVPRARRGRGPARREAARSKTSSRPRAGKKETTDHPPIYPTGLRREEGPMRDDRWKIYQLVVRRFLATLSGPAKTLRTTLRFDSGGEPLVDGRDGRHGGGLARGLPLQPPRRRGAPRPLRRRRGRGDRGKEILGKETQPPGRYGAGPPHHGDGGPRPWHQGDPPEHHPEPLRSRLRPRRPPDPDGEGHRAWPRPSRTSPPR